MTEREWATFRALGGADWLSRTLARARLTPEQKADRDSNITNQQQGIELDTARDPLVF